MSDADISGPPAGQGAGPSTGRGALVDVIDIQNSWLGGFCVDLGVLEPTAYTKTWRRPVPAFVEEVDRTIRTRLGILVNGHDRWWQRDDAAATNDVIDNVRRFGLPS